MSHARKEYTDFERLAPDVFAVVRSLGQFAAKAGLELLTKVMAVELAQHRINVNNIAPGAIETEMAKTAHDPATRKAYEYLIPMGRYGLPEEIADAAVFLSSDESRYVHGHTLNVDGGFREAGLMFGPDKTPPR